MEREMEAPGFWDDPERSNQKMKELKNLKDTVGECDKLSTQYDDILTLIDMGYEENDASLIPEIRGELDEFIREFDELRIGTLLSGEYMVFPNVNSNVYTLWQRKNMVSLV